MFVARLGENVMCSLCTDYVRRGRFPVGDSFDNARQTVQEDFALLRMKVHSVASSSTSRCSADSGAIALALASAT